jgi:predicted amidohydrolase
MKSFALLLLFVWCALPILAQLEEYPTSDVRVRVADHSDGTKTNFARFAQCQISISTTTVEETGLYVVRDESDHLGKLQRCVQMAIAHKANILIFPELALAMSKDSRENFIAELREVALKHRMIVVGGSFYDEKRYSRLVVIGPGWMEVGFKTHASRYEVSPLMNKGMQTEPEILLLKTRYGNLAVITCVDLISDDVQFSIRKHANTSDVDMLININDNPAAVEFLVEANSLVRRHPLFASITNVSDPQACLDAQKRLIDTGNCFGHTAVFADLRGGGKDPDSGQKIVKELPPQLLANGERPIWLDHLVGDLPPGYEGMLLYDINLRLKRIPNTTNAPDQGYPPIKNLGRISFQ